MSTDNYFEDTSILTVLGYYGHLAYMVAQPPEKAESETLSPLQQDPEKGKLWESLQALSQRAHYKTPQQLLSGNTIRVPFTRCKLGRNLD